MLEKFTLDATLGFLKRSWPLIVGTLLVAFCIFTQLRLNTANAHLETEKQTRVVLAQELGAPSPEPIVLIQTAKARVTESKDRKVALERISGEAVAAKKRADVADAQLKRTQAANTVEFAKAQKVINDLQHRKPTGNWPKDYQAIEQDSQAAWKGWKN